jgi:hypothetical protein
MKDKELREAVKKKMFRKYLYDSKTLIIDELGINHGSSRADIALLNKRFYGVEIKGDNDSLIRLNEQILSYNKVFDYIYIIIAYKHAYNVLKTVPNWWGVKIAYKGPRGAIKFDAARTPKLNHNTDKLAVLRLLWKGEALKYLNEFNEIKYYKYKKRENIYRRLAETTTMDQIKNMVYKSFTERDNWRVVD